MAFLVDCQILHGNHHHALNRVCLSPFNLMGSEVYCGT